MNSIESNTSNTSSNVNIPSNNFFNGNNIIIIILSFLLLLSFLGINLLNKTGDLLESITTIFGPLITQVLSIFGYTAGTVLDTSADTATNLAKGGLDIANGTLQSVADLLKESSKFNIDTKSKAQLDGAINNSGYKINEPKPDNMLNPIQNPISSNKSKWCLVGEYEGKRGCIDIVNESNCMSGQLFSSRELCMNPTKTVYTNPQTI